MTVLHEQTWKGSQSLDGEKIFKLGSGVKLRARVHRDSYDQQSYARVSILTDRGWAELSLLPIGTVPIHAHSYVADREVWEDDMVETLDMLIRLGVTVMG